MNGTLSILKRGPLFFVVQDGMVYPRETFWTLDEALGHIRELEESDKWCDQLDLGAGDYRAPFEK